MHKRILLTLPLSLCALSAMADCKNPVTQTEMNQCAALDLSKADSELNATYRKLMRQLDKPQQTEVKAIQLLWIKFKDQNCRFESSSAEGGSMQALLRDTCLTRLTETRTKDLQGWARSLGQ